MIYLFVGLEDVAFEHVSGAVSSDVAEDFEVLRVVRDVKYPATCPRVILAYSARNG